MLRISRITDYGLLLLSEMSKHPDRLANTRDLSLKTKIPHPTVSKVLKQLGHEGLLVSKRGINGGFLLAKDASTMAVLEVIESLEGPVAITDCSDGVDCSCAPGGTCQIQSNWNLINLEVKAVLQKLTISDLASRSIR